MAICENCGKPLILSGGKCIYCHRIPVPSNDQREIQAHQNRNSCQTNLQRQQQKLNQNHRAQSYHDIMVFYRMDGQEMALQINNGLQELGYDSVLMEIDNDFASKDNEYLITWKVQISRCKDFFFVITASMANDILNPMSDVHFLLRHFLPKKYGSLRFKDNVSFFIERHYLSILDENVFEQIRNQLDKDGYYSDVLGPTFVFPLKILKFDRKTGQYDVRGLVGRLNCDRRV